MVLQVQARVMQPLLGTRLVKLEHQHCLKRQGLERSSTVALVSILAIQLHWQTFTYCYHRRPGSRKTEHNVAIP